MQAIILKTMILSVIFGCNLLYAQQFDLLKNFETGSKIFYSYHYDEFNKDAYLDSSIVLTSFDGRQIVNIDSVVFTQSDFINYYLTIEKTGREIKKNYKNTLSDKNIDQFSHEVVCQNNKINESGAEGYIFGWIFPDTLVESVEGTWDPIIDYPYSRLYRTYSSSNSLLYIRDDTLGIQYRPGPVNFDDSYYYKTYYIDQSSGLLSYSWTYSYFQTGFSETYIIDKTNSIAKESLPEEFHLYQNYPNPFNPSTKIKYALSNNGYIKIIVYDALGREVKILEDGYKSAGNHEVEFDGGILASGVYIYKLYNSGYSESKKMMFLK